MSDIGFGNRLLVIDDEPALRRLVQRTAEGCGYEVVVTDDPGKFTTTARLWHPTLIMLDLRMPKVDGIQLLRELAADRCDAKVIIISGSDIRVVESALRIGRERGLEMSGMLTKPIRLKDLQDLLTGFARTPKEALRADLAEAIGTDQLYLEYQPKFDLHRRCFIGVEGLARWRHPRQGMIPPDAFILIAEESGLIDRFTDWVVWTAARQASAWQAQGLNVEIAVNLSARNIEDPNLPERLSAHCEEAGVDPATIILELTETGAMREAVQMMDVLTRLRLLGFRLSIDDFGTGYSSLVQLQRMPFSEVKIDKSFVMHMLRDESSRAIVEISIDLVRKLHLVSVAEGVEDEATLTALTALGCDVAQGFHLSRPIGAAEIPAMFRRSRAETLKVAS